MDTDPNNAPNGTVVVLVKDFSTAKARLAPALDAAERAALAERLARGFRLALGRSPSEAELTTLVAGFEADRSAFAAEPGAAEKFSGFGFVRPPEGVPAPEFAAYALAANVIINLDEFVMRE